MQEAALGGLEPHGHPDETVLALGDEIAPVGRARITPAQEVQVVPGKLTRITRYGQPLGLALRAVDERGADVLLGQRFHGCLLAWSFET
ncbi:hypothetical protein GCM10010398_33540 [Streptomyces fimbriatus]